MDALKLIKGGVYSDDRGSISFVNEFDLKEVRRFYRISHEDTKVVRAWQGHKLESKWFHCTTGSFEVKLILIDDWINPSPKLKISTFKLSTEESSVLYIPPGFVNGFRALEEHSSLIVFSDKTLDESKLDDFRFEINYWNIWDI